ncbi:MAG: hypothetical protein CMJ14_00345 [Pelagibacterales bacterium]|nr:hypothetical protein [Pelagibacterales bacterium]
MDSNKRIYLDGIDKSLLEKCKQRIIVISVVFFVTFLIVNIQLIKLSHPFKEKEITLNNIIKNEKRGKILDRNGNILAVSLPTWSLYSNNHKVINPRIVAKKINNILPNLEEEIILNKFMSDKRFTYIARHLEPNIAKKINKIGEPGLNFEKEFLRIYPYNEEISHIVGYVGKGKNGLSGIELKYNERLSNGEDIYLTIDSRIQYKLNKILNQGFDIYKYKGAVGIVMNAKNAEIIAAVSLPSFSPNIYNNFSPTINQITAAVFELGSIFKSFTIASSLNEDLIKIDNTYDATKPLILNNKKIRDDHPKNKFLNFKEIFVYSSNIGSALIALNLGKEKQTYYFNKLKLDTILDTGIPEVQYPLIQESNRDIHIATKSYGHGISVSPLNAIAALNATVNDGKFIEPLFVIDKKYYDRPYIQVFKKNVSNIMRKLYRDVVENEGGTAKKVQSEHYIVGGKTGTAIKVVDGVYNHKKVVSSFISFLPIEDPKYTIFILVDEPKATGNILGRTAGFNAVPLTKDLISEIAPILSEKSITYNEIHSKN